MVIGSTFSPSWSSIITLETVCLDKEVFYRGGDSSYAFVIRWDCVRGKRVSVYFVDIFKRSGIKYIGLTESARN